MRRAVGAVMVGFVVGCTAIAGSAVEALQPEIVLRMEGDGLVRILCWVAPVGPAGYRERRTHLDWSLVAQVGSWRVVASFSESLALAPGTDRTFVDWRIHLPVGFYTLS